MKKNIGLQRIDGHRSHLKGKRVSNFLGHIGFQDYQKERLDQWLKDYKAKKVI
jgi:hypothetical protein